MKYKAQKKYMLSEGKRLNDLARKDSKKFWKNIKKAGPSSNSVNIDQLHEHFQNMFGDRDPTELNQNKEHQIVPNLQLNGFNEDFDTDFTLTELSRAVYTLNNNKTPGMDSIPSEIIKASYDNISPFLLNLYNKMYNTGEYPRTWGESIIHPIFKKGDANDPQNYCGITLINVLAKIHSQLLLNRLTKWSTENETITDNQFGFQKGKSTTDCVFLLHVIISKVLNSSGTLYCTFIDYEKCFDKVDRSLLWQKLLKENVSCKFVKAVKSMYATIKLCIKYKNSYSHFLFTNRSKTGAGAEVSDPFYVVCKQYDRLYKL